MTGSLYLICGMAGAGKTTLARELETSVPAVRLCPDAWISAVLRTPNDRQEMDRIRPAVDEMLWSLGRQLLSLEVNVVLEQGLWSKDERMEYLDTARNLKASVHFYYLDVSRDELRRRIINRNLELPEDTFYIDPDEIDEWLTWFMPPDDAELAMYDYCEVQKS